MSNHRPAGESDDLFCTRRHERLKSATDGRLDLSFRGLDVDDLIASIPEIARLPDLTTLYLSGNRIGDPGAKAIAEGLRFRVEYGKGLPPGLIPRFNVQSHQNLSAADLRWKSGVVLRVPAGGACEVAVWRPVDKPNRVELSAVGPMDQRRAALAVAVNNLRIVNRRNKAAEPNEAVPVPSHPEVGVPCEYLLNLEEQHRGHDHELQWPGPDHTPMMLNVKELLSGLTFGRDRVMEEIRDGVEQLRRQGKGQPATIYADRSAQVSVGGSGSGDAIVQSGDAQMVKNSQNPVQPSAVEHQKSALVLHLTIVAVIGVLGLASIGAGIYAIYRNAQAPSEFDILGVKVSTGSVGVALVALGMITVFFTVRSVLRSVRDLAKIPHERTPPRRK
ncbi:MAG: hypothetical protein ACK4WH_03160 [Phycisphaerales bacterium]